MHDSFVYVKFSLFGFDADLQIAIFFALILV